jgi:outer membrane murein-binding lipoprotein Lpp
MKWILILAGLGAAGAFAYETGSQLARIEVVRLEEEVETLEAKLEQVEAEKRELRAELQATHEELQTWQQRYEAEVPSGEPAKLLDLVRARLDDGLSAQRLAFVVEKASETRECDAGPVTRQFIVQTPLSTGASQAVAFADSTITVTAEGESATNAQGQREAWFDPDKPITVRFTTVGGEQDSVEETLPIHHSIVRNGTEHRFSILAGKRAFVEVTWERCAYP